MKILVSACALLLSACAGVNGEPEIAGGCLPYSRQAYLVVVETLETGCLTQINAKWAATARHVVSGMPMVLAAKVVKSADYDLAFVRRDGVAPKWRAPVWSEPVTASGNKDRWGARSLSQGHAGAFATNWLCAPPGKQWFKCSPGVFTSARGGPGFSGGPLLARDGAVVGLLVQSATKPMSFNGKSYPAGVMIGYSGDFVVKEFERLVPQGER